MSQCGFPSAPENCKGSLSFVDNPAHVKGLAAGGHTEFEGKIFLCEWHADIICSTMALRGVLVTPKKLAE